MRGLLPLLIAVVLTVVFWSGLWAGGGLIGGDLYPYFFPQKVFYAEQLSQWRIPLWNDLVGFGYPVLGESQTGALYPPNLILYRVLGVNAAYNASQIGHYVAAFAAMYVFLTVTGIRRWCALFGAGVYVYSWFPPRICLEWAAIGGPYLPLGLWLLEKHLATGSRRWLGCLAVALACHLLAGHYNLAFIECVVWSVYVAAGRPRDDHHPVTESSRPSAFDHRPFLAIALGFGLASVQLLDTFALKQDSQRADVGDTFSPGYGHIPPAYLTQVAASHWWSRSSVDLDAAIQRLTPAVAADTNKVEAHFYFGLIPLGLALLQLIRVCRSGGDRRQWTLIGLAIFATVYATGVLVPVTQHLPGFGYFMGPGRWGIVVAITIAYLAARALQRILGAIDAKRRLAANASDRSPTSLALLALLSALTVGDLYLASRRVTYAFIVPQAPVDYLEFSPVKKLFDAMPRLDGPPRVYGPGQNVLTLLGVSQWPTYLGLGPAAYWNAMPERPEGKESPFYSDEQAAWLREHAVEYALTFEPVDERRWGLTRVWSGQDPVLNGIWGRGAQPLYLYRIEGAADSIEGPGLRDVTWTPGYVAASAEPDDESRHVKLRQAKITNSYGRYGGWRYEPSDAPRDPLVISSPASNLTEFRYLPGFWFISLPLTSLSLLLVTRLFVRRTR